MILSALIAEFRSRSKDRKKPYKWADDELGRWFTEAEKEAAVRARLIRKSIEIDISAGDAEINLDDRLISIEHAELRDAEGAPYPVYASSRNEMDRNIPGWRTTQDRPKCFVHDDKSMLLGCVSDADYTLYLECFVEPDCELKAGGDEPTISRQHHAALVDWVLFRAYSKPDSDTFNTDKAAEGEGRFGRYFGKSQTADMRRRKNASRPHRNNIHL